MNLIFVVIMMLILAVVIVAGYRAVKDLNTAVQNIQGAPAEAKEITQNVRDRYVGIGDGLFITLFVFSFIILIASAVVIDTHPIFFIIAFFMTVIAGFLGGHIANTYAELESSGLRAEAVEFTIIPFIFKHFVKIIVIEGMVVAIVLYAKLRNS
mgnify:CR=1 FL=1